QLRLLFSEAISNAIPSHAKQPRSHLLNRLHCPVRFHQFVKDILQNVFCVTGIGHTSADEVPEPSLLLADGFGDALILLVCHPVGGQHLVHLPIKTDDWRFYCMDLWPLVSEPWREGGCPIVSDTRAQREKQLWRFRPEAVVRFKDR